MAYCPLSGLPVFDQGYPVDGAQLYALDAGTTTPRVLYLTSDLDPTKVHPVPVVTSDGVLPVMWAGAGNYDVVLRGPDGGQIRRINGLRGETVMASASGAFDPNAQFSTGDIVYSHRTGARTGWVRSNGLTIGSAASTATERASNDTQALFVFLWNQDPNLLVVGGRGPTAAADWAANKTITLPDDRLRADVGCPDMGNADVTATRFANAVIGANGTVMGGTAGEAAHTLSTSEVGSTNSITTTSGSTLVATPGSVAPHNNVQPSIFRTKYMKL